MPLQGKGRKDRYAMLSPVLPKPCAPSRPIPGTWGPIAPGVAYVGIGVDSPPIVPGGPSEATKDIFTKISTIQTASTAALKTMDAACHRVKQSSTLAEQAGQSIKSIYASAGTVGSEVERITAALREQRESMQVFSQQVDQVSLMTGSNHDSAHGNSMLAGKLVGLADFMQIANSIQKAALLFGTGVGILLSAST